MSDNPPMIARYRGKSLDEMTREELVDAVQTLGMLYNNLLQQHAREAKMLFTPAECVARESPPR